MAHVTMMKKTFYLFLLLFLLSSFIVPGSGAAAAPARDDTELSFADLGMDSAMVLRGPYDAGVMRFDLPATWQLNPGAELAIDVTTVFTGKESTVNSSYSGATLEVYFNDKFQQSIPLLTNEKKTYYVPISPESMVSTNPGGWNKLSFFLYAEIDCSLDSHQTTVTIGTESSLTVPHTQAPLSLDLRRLPWPVYLQHVKQADPVTVVIPASPTADEMQAALVTMGAFGRITEGKLPMKMITVDQLTDDLRNQSHLVLVGKPSSFSMLSGLTLPVPLRNDQFSSPGMQTDDGVLQIVPSPWNDARAILMVSGNTDPAVVKAAQALSTLNLETGDTPDYSIVAKVSPAPITGIVGTDDSTPQPADIKLSDLGYGNVTVTGMGMNWIDYEFPIPLGMVPKETPYLNLNLSISSLVDPKRSEGIVYLNDVQIGSVPLSDDSSNLIVTQINMPLSVLRSGTNKISVVLNLRPYDVCTLFDFSSLWATVYADSVLHLPLIPAPDSAFALQDIKGYPYPFATDPSLSTTAFVMSKQDPSSWPQAGRIAYDLGARVTGPVLGFEAAFDGEVPEELRSMNLILVGEPKNLSILSDLAESMPARFEAGSNIAVLDTQQVVYRLSDKKSLGYLQLFASPWSNQKAISGVFGTTAAGLESALNALLDFQIRDRFAGNFVTLDGTKAVIVDTRTGTGMGNIVTNLKPSISPTKEAAPADGSSAQKLASSQSRQFILMGAMVVVVLMVVIIIIALWFRRKYR
jgi:cellulose synthase operon protein B